MTEVRPRHIRDLVHALKSKCGPKKKDLAPRTVRHVYGVLHRMFADAVADEVVLANPCCLKRGDLPEKVDKNPAWRSEAVFSHEEVERLLSDPRVPEERRVLYALLFLGGMRIGEAVALRWQHYQPAVAPLGKLLVAVSFNRKRRKEKSVKTGRPREVPVHPTLAAALEAWRAAGWAQRVGRTPRDGDLIAPTPAGEHQRDPVVNANLRRDLLALGMRPRRVHDARRTFISLSLADGARRDVLPWVTHGPKGDVFSLYTTLPWFTLCEEVGKLRIGSRAPPAKPSSSVVFETLSAKNPNELRAAVPRLLGLTDGHEPSRGPESKRTPIADLFARSAAQTVNLSEAARGASLGREEPVSPDDILELARAGKLTVTRLEGEERFNHWELDLAFPASEDPHFWENVDPEHYKDLLPQLLDGRPCRDRALAIYVRRHTKRVGRRRAASPEGRRAASRSHRETVKAVPLSAP